MKMKLMLKLKKMKMWRLLDTPLIIMTNTERGDTRRKMTQ